MLYTPNSPQLVGQLERALQRLQRVQLRGRLQGARVPVALDQLGYQLEPGGGEGGRGFRA